jgi:putative endopeptidase
MGKRKTQRRNKCDIVSNFYTVKNRRWMERTKIPATETRITMAHFISKDIDRQLQTVIQKQKEGPIADLLMSWRVAETQRIPIGISPILHLMSSLHTPADISTRIGWMCRHGIGNLLSIYVQGDPRDHRRCRIFIEEGTPRIGIPEYWLEDQHRPKRRAYETYVKELATIMGYPAMLMGFDAEREFAKVYPTYSERREPRTNMYSWRELQTEFKTVDWLGLLTTWGLPVSEIPHLLYNVTSPAFVHHIQQRMQRWSADRWRGWFALLVAQWISGNCPAGPLRTAWFNYKYRFLQGMKHDGTPQEARLSVVRMLMPNTLGRLWVSTFKHASLKRDVTKLVETVRDAAAIALKGTSWMAESTREAAVTKLRRMTIDIGWPDSWDDIELGDGLDSTDYVKNLLTLTVLSVEKNIHVLRKGHCVKKYGKLWMMPVFEVNAYYYPEENRILLPAGILNPPFYDPSKSDVWNYGAIGATVGHEICHGFDAEGRTYDEKGDKRDWWSSRNAAEFKKRAHAEVRLYETVDYRGSEVDGQLTLVENIADLGGLEFALAGLRLAKKRALTKAELREFFHSYTESWRSKDRLKRAQQLLLTDPHAPPMLRVNHVLRQMDEWYDAFDIDPSCPDYVPPAKRIHFFRPSVTA